MFETRQTLNARYQMLRSLGSGGQAHTMLAHDLQTNTLVAVKKFSLRSAESWKALELVEREAAVLRSLSHPGIPRFIDSFEITSTSTEFYLVQEYIEGESLRAILNAGRRWSEPEARNFLHAMLGILEYLHSFSPPIVHRDIKPDNIICKPDGSLVLVDFGAVQHILHNTIGGSTMVGTAGYLPPEQLMGRAVPASDLYALGATTIEMLSGIHPGDLPKERMKLKFDGLVQTTPEFAQALNELVEPHLEERFASVVAVRTALWAPDFNTLQRTIDTNALTALDGQRIACPVRNSRTKIHYTDMGLLIEIPSTASRDEKLVSVGIGIACLVGTYFYVEGWYVFKWMLLLAFLLGCVAYSYVLDIWSDIKIIVSPAGYQIHRSFLGRTFSRTGSLPTLHAVGIDMKRDKNGNEEYSTLRFNTHDRKIDFLATATSAEKEWAAEVVNNYLLEIRPVSEQHTQPLIDNNGQW